MSDFKTQVMKVLYLMNGIGLTHHDFFCHLCLLGSGVLLANTVVVFVLLPGSVVHRVLGNVAGQICCKMNNTVLLIC